MTMILKGGEEVICLNSTGVFVKSMKKNRWVTSVLIQRFFSSGAYFQGKRTFLKTFRSVTSASVEILHILTNKTSTCLHTEVVCTLRRNAHFAENLLVYNRKRIDADPSAVTGHIDYKWSS